MEQGNILGVRVNAVTGERASETVIRLSQDGHHFVCAANVHMLMESHDDSGFRAMVNSASLVVPDGQPLVWALRKMGLREAERITGSSLSSMVMNRAQTLRIPVGFYGAQQQVLDRLVRMVKKDLPGLTIVYAFSPPFRALSDEEDQAIVKDIVRSGVRILFVGLGCPKQERWMAAHVAQVPGVMIGVGAVFDFLAGAIPRAPRVLQTMGLEWLFRLILEPRRLWKRYLIENPRFVFNLYRQLFGF